MATPSTSASGPAPAPAPASSAFPLTAAARFLRVSAFSSTRAFALAERRRTPRCRLSEVGGGDRSVAAGRSPGPRSFHGLVLSGNAEGAMQSLRRELSSGMHPLRENFVALVHVFAKNDLTTKGMEILAAMERYKYGICKEGRASKVKRILFVQQKYKASEGTNINMVYEVGELFELGIQLSYLLILLGLLGAGTFFVIRQVLVRRELDLSAKELQEQVRSGDASATEYFELGAVMLRRKFYPAAIKYLQQAIQKWDRDEQDLAQVYNALGVSYKRDNKLDKSIQQFEKAVELQPGYVTAWNNLGDAYEQKKDLKSALKAFEEVLLFDPNNTVARPRRDDLKQRVGMYKGVPVKSEKR
ncbi:hypothetical protein OsJ_31796 [Oryza sativa Japonica Group]|uniref:Uncharacterized protein n=1 Tax=Oryza sativa subsp. japonica TaxID=39947 RepID=B9G644_ORYSJ|nr:hypothetical protein OsJ_31796 [Oryza sativa Japonica Group]